RVAARPQVAGAGQDRRVRGDLLEEPVTRAREDARGHVEAGDHAGEHHHGLGRHAPAVAPSDARGRHLEELRLLVHVPEHAVGGALAQRAHHRLRGGEVHVGDPEREDVLVVLLPLVARGGSAIDDAVEVEPGGHVGLPAAYTVPAARNCPASRSPALVEDGVMAYRINHIHLKSPDPRRTADWYVSAFRFTITSDETP